MLASEQNMMGQQFKPRIEHEEPSEDENAAKMNLGKDMNEVGKQINENQPGEFINYEGLKRVIHPKPHTNQSSYKENPFKAEMYQNPVTIFDMKSTVDNSKEKPPLPNGQVSRITKSREMDA
jgi:hypothetical protein